MTAIRPAAVAGFFYPADPRELAATVDQCMSAAQATVGPVPKAIIAPHAGYVYSGAVAASAYARVKPAHARISRVVLLGPCHRVAVRGLALSGADFFETPLGRIPVDRQAAALIRDLPQVEVVDATHAQEHSLEVHLPFLQSVLDDFAVVPLVVGEATADEVAEVLEKLWGGPETLIVISSDLSHYLDYDSARAIDTQTCRAIEDLAPERIDPHGACGRFPVGGLLRLAKDRGLTVETVDLRNSGDTAGGRDKVVGYGAWVFVEGTPAKPRATTAETATAATATEGGAGESDFAAATRDLLARHGEFLIRLAARSIDHGLQTGRPLPVNVADHPPELQARGACFVTLKKDGRLRGCIGSPEPHRPLVEDVAANGFSAAFQDPRFPKLTVDERPALEVSLSVLSPQRPMTFRDEADLLSQLRPGVDGLVISDGRRALFLPAVWQQLADPKLFLAHLKQKAGMPVDHWSPQFKAWRFVAEEISSADLDPAAPLWD